MGYACPVCEAPQADGEHLANHLAFSALLGRRDHETWLEEHAPDWEDRGPEGLAERITPHAEAVEFPELEETAGTVEVPDEGLDVPAGLRGGGLAADHEPLDHETRRAIERARELTRGADVDDEEAASREPDESE